MNIQRYAIFQHVRTGMRELYKESVGKGKPETFRRVSVWFVKEDAAEVERLTAERDADAATARAERAEEALRHLYDLHARGVFRLPDEHYAAITNAAAVLSSPPADATKMVGERELTDSALQESWDKMAGVQWSEPGTLMIERNTGKTVVVPKISERERRLTNLLAHMTDAYELAYGEDCPLVKQSRAALAEMEQKS